MKKFFAVLILFAVALFAAASFSPDEASAQYPYGGGYAFSDCGGGAPGGGGSFGYQPSFSGYGSCGGGIAPPGGGGGSFGYQPQYYQPQYRPRAYYQPAYRPAYQPRYQSAYRPSFGGGFNVGGGGFGFGAGFGGGGGVTCVNGVCYPN